MFCQVLELESFLVCMVGRSVLEQEWDTELWLVQGIALEHMSFLEQELVSNMVDMCSLVQG